MNAGIACFVGRYEKQGIHWTRMWGWHRLEDSGDKAPYLSSALAISRPGAFEMQIYRYSFMLLEECSQTRLGSTAFSSNSGMPLLFAD